MQCLGSKHKHKKLICTIENLDLVWVIIKAVLGSYVLDEMANENKVK